METIEVTDFPKLQAPFRRHTNEDGEYVVYNDINDGYEWVFEDESVRAVEKLDGTNTSVVLDENGTVESVYSRTSSNSDDDITYISPFTRTHGYIIKGVLNALSRGWLDDLDTSQQHYGELIGPKVNGNPYELEEHLFVPFEYLHQKVHYKSWGDYPKTYEVISEWFKNDLIPLFYARIHNCDFKDIPEDAFVEGIVFTHEDGRRAKLRRDMFDWYDGKRH